MMADALDELVYSPLIWLFRLSGVSPIERRVANLPLYVSPIHTKLGNTASFFAFALEATAAAYGIYFSDYLYPRKVVSLLGIFRWISSIAYITTPLVYLMQTYLKTDRYKLIWEDILKTQRKLRSGNQLGMQKTMFLWFVLQILLKIIGMVMATGISLMTVSMGIMDFAFTVPQLQHILMIRLLEREFSALNRELEHGVGEETYNEDSLSYRMANLFRLHSKLHEVVIRINSHFGFYNLSSIVITLMFMVMRMYMAFDYIDSQHQFEGPTSITMFSWVLFCVDLILLVSVASFTHSCSQEANRTVLIAHGKVRFDGSTPPQIMEQVEQFSLAMMGCEVRFSVAGVFNIDRSFVTKSAAASLTYLLIALQFKTI